MSELKKLADIPSGWGLMHDKTAVLHWFRSDNHPSIPLAESICGRHKSNDRLYRDVVFVGSRTKAKRCGDCESLRAIEELEDKQGHLPLTKAWDTDEQGRTLDGPFVCGNCDGGGCGICVG